MAFIKQHIHTSAKESSSLVETVMETASAKHKAHGFSLLLLTVAALLCLLSSPSKAEEKTTLGEWDVHHIVFGTTFLTPEIAKANNIVRSKFNALVNISVLDKHTQSAQNVALTGSATNLLGTKKSLSFKKVSEGDAIYYLAVLPFRDQETFRFVIDIQQGNSREQLKFQQKMFAE